MNHEEHSMTHLFPMCVWVTAVLGLSLHFVCGQVDKQGSRQEEPAIAPSDAQFKNQERKDGGEINRKIDVKPDVYCLRNVVGTSLVQSSFESQRAGWQWLSLAPFASISQRQFGCKS